MEFEEEFAEAPDDDGVLINDFGRVVALDLERDKILTDNLGSDGKVDKGKGGGSDAGWCDKGADEGGDDSR